MKTILLSSSSSYSNTRSASVALTRIGQTVSIGLNSAKYLFLLALLMVVATPQLKASDPIGVFALIDKVVLEPNETSPERIQIWGAFAFAEGRGDAYAAPKRGYLYYKLPAEKAKAARTEWADLKLAAGKSEVIGFGARYGEKGKLRKPDEKPENPDAYPVGWGLIRMKERDANYAPIRQLLALVPRNSTEKAKQPSAWIQKSR
ncbi:MAG: hypothetical protein FJ403_11770 [Verrucomicrobia bacterium]|nr:hypothetical protein [Verrucomicrobiota bacterium]